MSGIELFLGSCLLMLAAVQLIKGGAPGPFSRHAFPGRFWLLFAVNIAAGAFLVARALGRVP